MADKTNDFVNRPVNPHWPWECACGERHKTSGSALACRKCRVYVPDEPVSATNLLTGEELTIKSLMRK